MNELSFFYFFFFYFFFILLLFDFWNPIQMSLQMINEAKNVIFARGFIRLPPFEIFFHFGVLHVRFISIVMFSFDVYYINVSSARHSNRSKHIFRFTLILTLFAQFLPIV